MRDAVMLGISQGSAVIEPSAHVRREDAGAHRAEAGQAGVSDGSLVVTREWWAQRYLERGAIEVHFARLDLEMPPDASFLKWWNENERELSADALDGASCPASERRL